MTALMSNSVKATAVAATIVLFGFGSPSTAEAHTFGKFKVVCGHHGCFVIKRHKLKKHFYVRKLRKLRKWNRRNWHRARRINRRRHYNLY